MNKYFGLYGTMTGDSILAIVWGMVFIFGIAYGEKDHLPRFFTFSFTTFFYVFQ